MKFYTVLTTEFALNDLQAGRIFYDKQASLLGDYFFDALLIIKIIYSSKRIAYYKQIFL